MNTDTPQINNFNPERILSAPQKSFWRGKFNRVLFLCATLVLVIGIFVVYISLPPSDFPTRVIIVIPNGASVTSISQSLKQNHIIKYSWVYKLYVLLVHDHLGVKAGSYLFDKPESALRVAYRTSYSIQNLQKIKVTIPEGSSSKDISAILGKSIPNFASSTFLTLAREREGYLFPDTYFFYENTQPSDVIDQMNINFNNQIATIEKDLKLFGRPVSEIIKMSSIVEKEATSTIDRRIIAGILWKRIDDKYPLQVDPPFFYFLGKDSSDLTRSDLATESPYNLYKHIGLPPTPIDSPGLDTIYDTIHPTATKYWYYLSDKKGNMHYGVTYEDHLTNKRKYLR